MGGKKHLRAGPGLGTEWFYAGALGRRQRGPLCGQTKEGKRSLVPLQIAVYSETHWLYAHSSRQLFRPKTASHNDNRLHCPWFLCYMQRHFKGLKKPCLCFSRLNRQIVLNILNVLYILKYFILMMFYFINLNTYIYICFMHFFLNIY